MSRAETRVTVACRFSACRVEAGGWRLEAGGCRLAGNPRYRRRRSSAMYRYIRGAPGLRGPFCWSRPLLLPCWVYAPSLPLVLPYLAAEHGNGLRRPRLPSGRTLMLGRVRRESRRESLASLPLATPRLVSPRFVSRARDLGARASRISLWLSF